jgi:NTP pyrophosphatase (non-canonical NTP hydrolase)
MEFRDMVHLANEVRDAYEAVNQRNGFKPWGISDYAQGFVGDVGDLQKMVMAKAGVRSFDDINRAGFPDVDAALAHELADCLWSVMVLAAKLGVDLETVFLSSMDALKERISRM